MPSSHRLARRSSLILLEQEQVFLDAQLAIPHANMPGHILTEERHVKPLLDPGEQGILRLASGEQLAYLLAKALGEVSALAWHAGREKADAIMRPGRIPRHGLSPVASKTPQERAPSGAGATLADGAPAVVV